MVSTFNKVFGNKLISVSKCVFPCHLSLYFSIIFTCHWLNMFTVRNSQSISYSEAQQNAMDFLLHLPSSPRPHLPFHVLLLNIFIYVTHSTFCAIAHAIVIQYPSNTYPVWHPILLLLYLPSHFPSHNSSNRPSCHLSNLLPVLSVRSLGDSADDTLSPTYKTGKLIAEQKKISAKSFMVITYDIINQCTSSGEGTGCQC